MLIEMDSKVNGNVNNAILPVQDSNSLPNMVEIGEFKGRDVSAIPNDTHPGFIHTEKKNKTSTRLKPMYHQYKALNKYHVAEAFGTRIFNWMKDFFGITSVFGKTSRKKIDDDGCLAENTLAVR